MEEQERNHVARKLIAAVSFYDLGQRKPSSAELVQMAKAFNYEAGARFLARLNVCLSLAIGSGDENILADVSEKLTAGVLSLARLQEVTGAFGDIHGNSDNLLPVLTGDVLRWIQLHTERWK